MDDAERFTQSRYKHWTHDHVRFSDLDPLGHVNNNAIGQYFENARAALFMEVTPKWPRRDHLFVLARIAMDFRRELHMPAELRIGTAALKLGRTSLILGSALFRGEDGIAYGETVSVYIDNKTRKPIEIPQELRDILQGYRT
jgi:acyl-CoA thioester hydrolase